jgi:hypothetical protein
METLDAMKKRQQKELANLVKNYEVISVTEAGCEVWATNPETLERKYAGFQTPVQIVGLLKAGWVLEQEI